MKVAALDRRAQALLLLLPLVCTAVFGLFWTQGSLDAPENYWRDKRYRLRHFLGMGPELDPRMTLVAIDKSTLQKLGASEELWFEHHLEVCRRLAESGAETVVLALPWGLSPSSANRWPDLGRSLERASTRLVELRRAYPLVVRSSPAAFELTVDADGKVRRYPADLIAFAAAAELGSKPQRSDAIWIDFSRRDQRDEILYERVLQANLDFQAGKIFVIGRRYLKVNSPLGDTSELELHAQALNSLLSLETLEPAPFWLESILVFAFGVGVCLCGLRSPPYLAPGHALALLLGVWTAAVVAFLAGGLWLNMVGPALVLLPCLLGTFLIRFRLLDRERQRIRQLLSSRVSEEVMQSLLEHPEQIQLGGKRCRITMLFSDITGFTSACERLPPEEVLARLNLYLAEMNEIIFRHGGTIRQFAGDEVVVLFGTPVESENHAVRAINAALEMLERLKVLKVEYPEGFHRVKIGIHTGEVVVGDIGSAARAEFTAVGDNVNVTARIEALNKDLGTQLLVSNSTRLEVLGRIEDLRFESMGFQMFKGKTEPVEVFKVERVVKI